MTKSTTTKASTKKRMVHLRNKNIDFVNMLAAEKGATPAEVVNEILDRARKEHLFQSIKGLKEKFPALAAADPAQFDELLAIVKESCD